MKGGNLSRHKRTKLGMLPGDIPIQEKARVLEKLERPLPLSMDPKGTIGKKCAKSMKRDFVKIANRRSRRSPVVFED